MESLSWELFSRERDSNMGQLNEPLPELRSAAPEFGEPAVCRMGRWFGSATEAESMLGRLKERGWNGSMRDCGGIWHVDVVRPLLSE